MGNRVVLALVVLAGCASDSDPDIRIERQTATIADAKATSWTEGGAVLVGVPGTFSFPQPLSIRVSIVDSKQLDADMLPTQLRITSASVAMYGTSTELQVVSQPTCQQNYCTAELKVMAAGQSMLTVEADGPDGKQSDCFYYGVYEDADPAAIGATHQTELEAEQSKCRAAAWN